MNKNTPSPSAASAEEQFFQHARQLGDLEQVRGYLDSACAGHPDLRQRVERLLDLSQEADAFFERKGHANQDWPAQVDVDVALATKAAAAEVPGNVIGRYKLLEKLGEGGFGVVYMAEQRDPVKRRVALKIIKAGMDTREVVARFEAERQALAMMDHPNIAKVLDGGATESGRPYFVLELVRGIKITDYCELNHLALTERLKLFMQVCQAVQHAHQKGIIHRDLKPSNILVTLHDGVPASKVIDFGIAKATQQELTEKTVFTRFHQFIGTPAYMSPEQAELSGLDIDTRSDIYSLGVLLYELLTGATPFDQKALLEAGLDEMRRIIRETEPVRPSTRLTQARTARMAGSPQPAIPSPQSVMRHPKSEIDRDLDWIVMKCLEKDRARRYETAIGLVADIQRHLRNEVVTARPPSAAYKLQKAWRRNKLVWTATVLVVAAMVIGLTVSAWQARVALHARQQADHARLAEAAQRRIAQTATEVAESERAKAQQVAANRLNNLYAADIRVAYQALQRDDFALAKESIGKYLSYVPVSHYAKTSLSLEPKGQAQELLGWEWRYLWQLCRSDAVETLQSASNAAHRAVLALHNRFLVTASDRWLRVIDLRSMEVVATLGGPEEFDGFIDLGAVAFSGDGRYLAAKGGSSVRVWRVGQWQSPYKRLKGLGNVSMNSALAFSPDGGALGTRVDGGIGFWDSETWQMKLLPAPERLGTMIKYSGDGAFLAMDFWNRANKSGDLQILDAKTLAPITTLVRRPAPVQGEEILNPLPTTDLTGAASAEELRRAPRDAGYIRVLAADFSDRFLAVGYRDGELKLFDLATWAEVASVPAHPSFLFGLAFSPDGRFLATGGKDQSIKLWDVSALTVSKSSGALPKPVKKLRGHHGSILALVFAPDGKNLLSAGYDGTVKVWDPYSAEAPRGLPGAHKAAWFSQDARRLITQPSRGTGELSLWDTATRVKLGSVVPAAEEAGDAIGTVSDDGQWAALGTSSGVIDVWNLETKQQVLRIEAGVDLSTHQLAFSPGGGWLAAAPPMAHHATSEGGLRLWNLEPGGAGSPMLFREGFAPFAFCSDDRRLVFARKDGVVQVDDFHREVCLAQWKAHAAPIHSLALSPDNRLLATGAEDALVRVWDLESHERTLELKGHLTGIPAMAFAPDGRTLVTVTWDSTIKLWHLATGRELFTVDDFRMVLWSARFSPNGEYLAVCGDDGNTSTQLMLLRAPSWEEIAAKNPVEHIDFAWP